ncbi:MAG: helix-turn-helix domain-containing protein [Betaproteobacteria bacterium]|nr:helix-turn-helix domain-containing protein [Betaproteobacteria bacterium]
MYSDLDTARYEPSEFHPCLVTPSRPATACIDTCAPGSRIAKLITDFPIAHQRLRQGEHLFRAGATFHSLYVLNAGFAKTCHVSEDGQEQTTGFHLRGDILGLDAVATGTYGSDAIALDLCDVLAIPYEAVIANGQRNPDLVRELHRAFSSEIRSERELMLSLGSLAAEGRVAAFLLEMSQRFGARGFSATDLQLRLTRQEIGSLLGLKLETVSRAFSHFARLGIVSVHLRQVVLLQPDRLREVIGHSSGLGHGPALSDII